MPVFGTVSSMDLPDLLQWAASARKTGGLHVEQAKVSRRIFFREGRISGCSSDDPPSLLGQFLLSRGKISEDILRETLNQQERNGGDLGSILVEAGFLTRDEIERCVAAKAEEMIIGLFEWKGAIFRFDEAMLAPAHAIQVDFSVEQVLMDGATRRDELEKTRAVFHDPGMVLTLTEHPPDPSTITDPMAERLYRMIDGKRTLGEILLHSHGSEFLVHKFLYQLLKAGLIKIKEVRSMAPDPGTPAALPDAVRAMLSRGEFEAALEILNAVYRERPEDGAIRSLLAKAETAFIEHLFREELPPSMTPILMHAAEALVEENLSPTEYFLISLIKDGTWNVQSLLWIAPMRGVDVLRGLKRLVDREIVAMIDSAEPSLGHREEPAPEPKPMAVGSHGA